MHIAFATTSDDALDVNDMDRAFHQAAFDRVGVALDHCRWRDPTVEWSNYDLVVVRSVWDYVEHVDEFMSWLQQVDTGGILRNPGPVVAWNLDKRYLFDLAGAGVPVIPTRIAASVASALEAATGFGGEVVVKPVVSAGSRNTGRFRAADPMLEELVARILGEGGRVLVQPSVSSVATEGEVGTVLFDGVVSHSFRKGPILALGGGRVDGHNETFAAEALDAEQRRVVDAAMEAVDGLISARFGLAAPLLYARIDLVRMDDGTPVVLEVELAEPAFYLETAEGAADRFLRAVLRQAAERAGHRHSGPGGVTQLS